MGLGMRYGGSNEVAARRALAWPMRTGPASAAHAREHWNAAVKEVGRMPGPASVLPLVFVGRMADAVLACGCPESAQEWAWWALRECPATRSLVGGLLGRKVGRPNWVPRPAIGLPSRPRRTSQGPRNGRARDGEDLGHLGSGVRAGRDHFDQGALGRGRELRPAPA